MNTRENIFSSIIFIIISIYFILESLKMDLMRNNIPGPGAFPLLLAVILIILSVMLIFNSSNKKNKYNYFTKITRKYILNISFIIFISFIYFYFLLKINFIVLTVVYLFIFILFLKKEVAIIDLKSILFTMIISITITGIIYLFFSVILDVAF
ncbi:MAG: tripartite tricarboxylate transporter TctB family protein [bacterium]